MMSHIIMQTYLKFHCQKVDLTEMANFVDYLGDFRL